MATKKKSTTPTSNGTAESNSNTLRERAMLVSLTLSKWSGRMADSETTNEVLNKKGAQSDAGAFRKFLIPRSELSEVTSLFSLTRSTFKKLTLPWDEGVGILKAENFMAFSERMSELQEQCRVAAAKFIETKYPELLKSAPARLGKLYRKEDFPSPDELREKFDTTLTVLPIPDKDDFRVELGSEAMTRIHKDIERHVTAKLQTASKDLWVRVLEVVQHFAEVMKDKDAKFKDVTVSNLASIAAEVKNLSIVADPKLDAICGELQKMSTAVPDVLRDNPAVRADTAKTAAETVARIERIMAGAF